MRGEHRNYTAHGAFGKDGRVFQFHGVAGATPLRLGMTGAIFGVTLQVPKTTDDAASIAVIEAFSDTVQAEAKPQWLFPESGMATILLSGASGEYARAMISTDAMRQ